MKIFKNPPAWLLILAYTLTLLSMVGSLAILFFDYSDTAFEWLAYCLFGIAGTTLAYSVYTLVRFSPRIKAQIKAVIEKNSFTDKFVKSFGFRALVGSFLSLSVSILFGIFNGALGIMSSSVWYGSLALYYILLALIYGSIVLNRKPKSVLKANQIYRRCGILLLILNSALSVAIGQMIFDNEFFEYGGLMIYASAAYAFYKITMAIIRFFRHKRECNPILNAIVSINLTDGMVSILALQTALLSTFGNGSVNVSHFNTVTGSFVSLITLSIGIFMIIKGTKNIKSEKNNERQ
ncbi:MAG: hypothetical protein E7596_02555 [Ruminococcaceae bacterium]|nr:hypothetical protein [Oscillospiraceae bacterium]